MSLVEALKHAGITYDTDIDIHWVDAELLTEGTVENELKDVDGICVPGGFGTRGIEGKITAIRYARESKKPFLGVGPGMQLAAVEYARNVLGLEGAHTIEVDENTPHPITKLLNGKSNNGRLGGTLASARNRLL